MYINLAGEWCISLEADEGRQSGKITLPGTLQAAGYGNPITRKTPWVSTLHNSYWYEQEEYKFAQEKDVNVPFLSQPPRHFLGQAVYGRSFVLSEESQEEWHFYAELARWRSQVWIDGEFKGEDCTLCGPHDINLGCLAPGGHTLRVVLDNSMLYPYRPDAHGVSDALGSTWNGLVGEIALFTEDISRDRKNEKLRYAQANPRTVEARDGRFYIDGEPFYFRATHFGGEYPLTGYPSTDKAWWLKRMSVIKEWGLNGIRFHSYCPPEAAFSAADEAGVYLLVECGMWNRFQDGKEGGEMFDLLRRESRRVLENFGHHPSFVFFSPSNEPGGRWYKPLRRWVSETRDYDKKLGYGGRRIYTAQSGWAYDVPPAEIQGTDFIYFHRSGATMESAVRSKNGWKGRDFSSALRGVAKPVICHELGQICAYPNYEIMDKFKGFLQPGNYKVFRENARANGILPYADSFVMCSGENQIRLYKEELEANFRTPELQGFELLDLHDYLGQGTALVGILDAFWENKGYGDPAEFRDYCGDTVILARISSYVWKNTDMAQIPVEVCHYGREEIEDGVIRWRLCREEQVVKAGELPVGQIVRGGNTRVGSIELTFGDIRENAELTLLLTLDSEKVSAKNSWNLYVFVWKEFVQSEEVDFSVSELQFSHTEEEELQSSYTEGELQSSYAEGDEMQLSHTEEEELQSSYTEGDELQLSPAEEELQSPHTEEMQSSHAEELQSSHTEEEELQFSCTKKDKLQSSHTEEDELYTDTQDTKCVIVKGINVSAGDSEKPVARVSYTRDWKEAKAVLEAGGRVVYAPWMSDLGFESPALSGKSVQWNGQMGPAWCRTMGIVVEEEHPIFRHFPTRHSGGWQWENILANARGFHMEGLEQIKPIVQPIDDWNRNLLQSVMFEARVGKGRLLLVSANLEGSFEESPERYSLKQAILEYAASEEFQPEGEADPQAIEHKLFPMLRMQELTDNVTYGKGCSVRGSGAVVEADPDTSTRIIRENFPVEIIFSLKKSVAIKGFVYVPEQRDRDHAGFAREYRLEAADSADRTLHWEIAAEGVFLNTCRSQQVLLEREVTGDLLKLTVLSAYGCEDKFVWEQGSGGWHQVFRPLSAIVQIAGFHVLCDEEASHSDVYSIQKDFISRTKEIDF